MKFILLLIPIILLSSCTIDWNDEKVFEKKQECTSYKDKFNKESGFTAQEVFYSPSMNTCIIKYFSNNIYFLKDALTNENLTDAEIPSSCKTTFGTDKNLENECINKYSIFETKLNELKGE